MRPIPRLVLFTRFPAAGQAKTRLIPVLGAAGASEVHKKLTERTVATLCAGKRVPEVHYTGDDASAFADWLGPDVTLVPQRAGDLGERLLAALDPAPVIFFGADTPDLDEAHVAAAIAALETHEVVIGPAKDGGYYLIGMARPLRYIFENMPWSTERVFPETCARLKAQNIVPVVLETLSDCDRPEDLTRWPWLIP
jgi:uncharacterized protein